MNFEFLLSGSEKHDKTNRFDSDWGTFCESLLRVRARAKMIVKGGVCTAGCDERELCGRVCTLRII